MQAVVNTIASLTAMIPLGLVLMTSIAFAVGAAKLAGRQVLVNELPAVEGLARVDVICLDKTGTLTARRDRVRRGPPADRMPRPAWERVLAWYGAAPDANATARCLREPYPVAGPARPSPRTSRSPPPASGAPCRSTTAPAGTWVLGAPEMVFGDAAIRPGRASSAAP